MARVFKNMRSRMVDDGLIKAGVAPSYYIEGLLYNVPNEKLTSSYQDCVVNVLNWYRQEAKKAELVRSEEHTSELQSLMRISYAVFCLQKKTPVYNEHLEKRSS